MRVKLSFEADKTPVMRAEVDIDGHKRTFVRKDPSVVANNVAAVRALRSIGREDMAPMRDDLAEDANNGSLVREKPSEVGIKPTEVGIKLSQVGIKLSEVAIKPSVVRDKPGSVRTNRSVVRDKPSEE